MKWPLADYSVFMHLHDFPGDFVTQIRGGTPLSQRVIAMGFHLKILKLEFSKEKETIVLQTKAVGGPVLRSLAAISAADCMALSEAWIAKLFSFDKIFTDSVILLKLLRYENRS